MPRSRRRHTRDDDTDDSSSDESPSPPKRRSRSQKRSPVKRSRSPGGRLGANQGYCVKCKGPCTMVDVQMMKTRKGQNMICGKCDSCGTKVCKFVKND